VNSSRVFEVTSEIFSDFAKRETNIFRGVGKFIKRFQFLIRMVMKKIFERNFDDEIHSAFLKFGRGEYKYKFLAEGKKQASKWSLKTGPEFVNMIVKKCLEKVGGDVAVKGIIVSTHDLRDEFDFEIVKASNFQGVRKFQINTTLNPATILDLMERYPRVFFALSFSGEDFALKVKAKAPTSGKPGKEKEDGPAADFCTLKTKDSGIVKDLFFDVDEFKEVKVNHLINVTDIVYPSNMDELKPTEIREQAKRKGKIFRKITIDGKEKVNECDFVA